MRSSRFRAMSCALRARAGSRRSGSSVRAPSRSGDSFGPDWLRRRLAHLLPEFPDVALCVALSGGVDSTALLAAIVELRSDASREGTRDLRLRAVHIDHG